MIRETQIEESLIGKLTDLKYTYRQDIRDRETLETNFRQKFQALNRVNLTDAEFMRLRDEIINSDVFASSKHLRERNTFMREDGTPLHYTLVNIKEWCKNDFEVINQLRINTENSHQRYDDLNDHHFVLLYAYNGTGKTRLSMEFKDRSKKRRKNPETDTLYFNAYTLHGVKDTEFEIHHGDTLLNDWDILNEMNPAKKKEFDAIVANPPFSYRWEPNEAMGEDFRFKSYGLAPKSAADFAFLLHGFHFLGKEGCMAIILPHGVLFRGGAEERIRTKLLKDGNIDTVIGLPANLFFSTGIPVCILVLKKCKKFDDVLFINASEHYKPGKRQNSLEPEHIDKIVETYQHRPKAPIERYARRVSMDEIEKNDFNLNISRYVSTTQSEKEINLKEVNKQLVEIEKRATEAAKKHNKFLKELGLPPI